MSAHHHHGHDHGPVTNHRRLAVTLGLTAVYMVAEVVGGLISGSLALLADAGHMLSDVAALALALLVTSMAARPPSPERTFGHHRAEVLGALANGATLLAVSFYVFHEAYQRVLDPPVVQAGVMMGVAIGGLLVNLVGLMVLHGGRHDSLNVRGAWLHVMADALGSVGAIVAAVLIQAFGWRWADPVASAIIGALVLYSAWGLIKETTAVLMQSVPRGIDVASMVHALNGIEGVLGVHDVHVWSMNQQRTVGSCHLRVQAGASQERVLDEARQVLDRFGVRHTTVQVETSDRNCRPCETSSDDHHGHDHGALAHT